MYPGVCQRCTGGILRVAEQKGFTSLSDLECEYERRLLALEECPTVRKQYQPTRISPPIWRAGYPWATGRTFQWDTRHAGELLVILCLGASLVACIAFQS